MQCSVTELAYLWLVEFETSGTSNVLVSYRISRFRLCSEVLEEELHVSLLLHLSLSFSWWELISPCIIEVQLLEIGSDSLTKINFLFAGKCYVCDLLFSYGVSLIVVDKNVWDLSYILIARNFGLKVECETVTDGADNLEPWKFEIAYDKLVIALGAQPTTFGIRGVEEHAVFLREVYHAQEIRRKLLLNLMLSDVPGMLMRVHSYYCMTTLISFCISSWIWFSRQVFQRKRKADSCIV